MFIGREHELEIIKKAIASNVPELGVVYGRRRVGKSMLLQETGGRKGDLYFEALQDTSSKLQIEHFLNQLAEQTGAPRAAAKDWREAFDALSFYLDKGRHYVVFDEFPWMAAGRNALTSLFKYYWDNRWKKNSGLTMVLCGSVANFMFKHIVHSKALHNRKTFEIKLRPLPAHEAKQFFKDYRSDFEIARFLMVFGGIPKYLEQLDPRRSLGDNLDRLCFQRNSFFLTEFETIFKEQFKVTKTYEQIVSKLAGQSYSRETLARRLKMKPGGGLTGYIRNLEQADFVRVFKPMSVTGRGERTRRVVLWDEWLRFYFTFVEPNRSIIELNSKPGMFEQLASRSFEPYCGLAFERLCMKNLPSILARLNIGLHQVVGYGPFFRQPGRKSRRRTEGLQIDILVQRKGDVLTLIECKFRSRPIGVSVIREVEQKIKLLKAPSRFSIERVLLCAGETTSDLEGSGYFHEIVGLESVFSPL
ncbi:MAG: ATP-binding protein [Planctomycetota bacterium]|nr:ATP-binding protein [Planctomycetota bacterium]